MVETVDFMICCGRILYLLDVATSLLCSFGRPPANPKKHRLPHHSTPYFFANFLEVISEISGFFFVGEIRFAGRETCVSPAIFAFSKVWK